MKRNIPLAAALAGLSLLAACSAQPAHHPVKPLTGQTVEVAASWSLVEQVNFQAALTAFAN